MKDVSAVRGFLQEKEGRLALLHYTLSLRVVGVDCFIISRKGVKAAECKTKAEPEVTRLGFEFCPPPACNALQGSFLCLLCAGHLLSALLKPTEQK